MNVEKKEELLMTMRRTMKARRARTALAIAAGLALTVAGCGGGENEGNANPSVSSHGPDKDRATGANTQAPSSPASEGVVLAEVKGANDITLTVNSAVRDQGGFVTVGGQVKNSGNAHWAAPNWQGTETELASNGPSMAGASLTDKQGKKKYLILRDTDGRCLCTNFGIGIAANQESSWFAQFPAPPASTKNVDFQVGDMPPASIEISDGE